MSDFAIGVASFPALLALIFLRVPIGLAMFLVGFLGYVFLNGDATMPAQAVPPFGRICGGSR